jgi:hypothetical protein
MEGYCSTGQSPQRTAVPVEEEEELIHWINKEGHTVPCFVFAIF